MVDRGTISIDDYSITLRPLPHDATQQEVWQHGLGCTGLSRGMGGCRACAQAMSLW